MKRLLRVLILLLLATVPLVQSDLCAQAKKTTTTTKKTNTQAQKTSTQTQKSKQNTQAKKPATQTKKPATQGKKPAVQTKKPAAEKSQQNTSSTKPQRKLSRAEYEKQQKELIKQIAATEQMISDNDKSVLSQSRDIKLREDEINKRMALLTSMQDEIESIKQDEDSLRDVIAHLKQQYQGKQEKYAAAIQHIYKWRSGYDEWLFVLSASDVTESMRRIRFLRQYSRWREQEAHSLKRQRLATESVQEKLTLVRQQREAVMNNLQKERDVLAKKQQKQQASLDKLKSKQKELKKALARDQQKQKEIQRMITKLIEEERKKASAQQSGGKSSSNKKTGPAIYTPAEIEQLTGSFRQNKGKMPYPVDSPYSILSHYTKDGNYSITLSSTIGAQACAIFEGTVQRVVKSSEDYTVIVCHGEYMSVYSNLSVCHVKEGDKLKMRQSIGKIKQDIDGHCVELMFWIYGKNEAENPELWLKR